MRNGDAGIGKRCDFFVRYVHGMHRHQRRVQQPEFLETLDRTPPVLLQAGLHLVGYLHLALQPAFFHGKINRLEQKLLDYRKLLVELLEKLVKLE